MSEKRQHFLKEYDWIRKGLMFEPRGHDMMSGSILYPPTDSANDAGVLFIETSGCLPMCGHGTIGTVTIALEHGLIKPKVQGVLNLEVPAGLVKIEYVEQNRKIKSEFKRGRTKKGLLELNIHRIPFSTMPGAARGIK